MFNPKLVLFLAVQLTACYISKAQVNYAVNFNPNTSVQASGMYPSMLASGDVKFSFNLFGIYTSASNNRLGFEDVYQLANSDVIKFSDITNLLSKFRGDNNRLSINNEVQIADFSLRIKSKKGNHTYIQLGSKERMEANIQIPKNIFTLAAEGNEQWAGYNINLGPLAASSMWYRENYLAVAKTIHVGAITLYPALRFNYLQGIANAYSERSDAYLYTDPNGRYLTLDVNYKMNVALPQGMNDALFNTPGRGFAMDAGMGVSIGKHLLINAGVTDIGGITFTRNTHQYFNDTSVTYTGVPVIIDSEQKDANNSLNGFSNLTKTHETNVQYRASLPARAAIQAEYRGSYVEKRNYYRNHLYASIVMGLTNMYGATARPQMAAGYTRSFGRILSLGLNSSFGGYYPWAAGGFISFHPGIFHFELGTNNLNYFLSPKDCYGAAAYIQMGFSIR